MVAEIGDEELSNVCFSAFGNGRQKVLGGSGGLRCRTAGDPFSSFLSAICIWGEGFGSPPPFFGGGGWRVGVLDLCWFTLSFSFADSGQKFDYVLDFASYFQIWQNTGLMMHLSFVAWIVLYIRGCASWIRPVFLTVEHALC